MWPKVARLSPCGCWLKSGHVDCVSTDCVFHTAKLKKAQWSREEIFSLATKGAYHSLTRQTGDQLQLWTNCRMKAGMILLVTMMVISISSATMNVGTFWFAQNNGKFVPRKPYSMTAEFQPLDLIGSNQNPEQVRRPQRPWWWTEDFNRFWATHLWL